MQEFGGGQLYGHGNPKVLFKPTKAAAEYPFRPTAGEEPCRMLYYVGDGAVEMALKPRGFNGKRTEHQMGVGFT
jgi:hypothetical protein